jgi:hypothetical protein
MVSILQIRAIGTAMLVLGLLVFLYGLVTVAKNVLATAFVLVIIAVTLLYYARRMSDRPR